MAFDPRKPDPNTSGKLKIDLAKFPNGLQFTVKMDKKPYLSFVTGDGANLDNLFVPPGVQSLSRDPQERRPGMGLEYRERQFQSEKEARL